MNPKKLLFRWLYDQTGLYITANNEMQVLQVLKEMAFENGLTQENLAYDLIHGQLNPQAFIDLVTTHESFFLRHKKAMLAVISQVIKPLIRRVLGLVFYLHPVLREKSRILF